MHHFIYQTTNLINGMKYLGKHSTKNINDGYLGSGIYLINAIKKYGKENFKVEILEFCETKEELSLLESKYITKEIVENDQYYNIALGGYGGNIVLHEGHPKYEEVKQKLAEVNKRNSSKISERVKLEHKKAKELGIPYAMAGKKQSQKQKEHAPLMGKRTRTKEEIDKRRESVLKTFSDPSYIHPAKGKKKNISGEMRKRIGETSSARNSGEGNPNYGKRKFVELSAENLDKSFYEKPENVDTTKYILVSDWRKLKNGK